MGEPPPNEPLTLPSTTASAVSTTDPATVDLDDEAVVLRPRVSVRRRAAQGGAVLAVVIIVVVALLLHSLGLARQGTASASATATPLPPTVLIDSNVTFGTLTVNGHTL